MLTTVKRQASNKMVLVVFGKQNDNMITKLNPARYVDIKDPDTQWHYGQCFQTVKGTKKEKAEVNNLISACGME
ncbi:hypothetical protein EVAR_101115_1 [Eumeta japonica]|uniref:Uncharacterized protein n=1 Tax=Eumeta variegata TaxID=151549 RepID=A0A4C2A247_EUMVA|nr:hypothetical protein EVAR_101115_1 [Eumeta japonica]